VALSDVFRRQTKWTLADAVERHRLAPETFRIPDEHATASLQVGDRVKVVVEPEKGLPERMWVVVTAVSDSELVGTFHSDAVEMIGLHAGDAVQFERRHVVAIGRRVAE
jgi:hypothetical protein